MNGNTFARGSSVKMGPWRRGITDGGSLRERRIDGWPFAAVQRPGVLTVSFHQAHPPLIPPSRGDCGAHWPLLTTEKFLLGNLNMPSQQGLRGALAPVRDSPANNLELEPLNCSPSVSHSTCGTPGENERIDRIRKEHLRLMFNIRSASVYLTVSPKWSAPGSRTLCRRRCSAVSPHPWDRFSAFR